jgi:alpha-L-fucosidase
VIDRETYYDWDSTIKLVYSLQPDIIIFSDAGPGCRWIGNEQGFAGETNWSTINADSLTIGASRKEYLNTGDAQGTDWVVGECDVSIRPGWFYHEDQDDKVKSLEQLRKIYLGSVGRNAVLLLNIPPDKRGLIHEYDEAILNELADYISSTFGNNLASNARASSQNIVSSSHHPDMMFDDDINTFWAGRPGKTTSSVVVELSAPKTFNLIMLGEYIPYGQRISGFNVEIWENNAWRMVAEGTTIGYKRILETDTLITSKLRLNILESKESPLLSSFGLYLDKYP